MTRGFPLVLCYHAASAEWTPCGLSIDPPLIERQVANLLRRGFRPITAAETLERRGRYLHVTFDDAYLSLERVLPALERMHVPVTVFACAGLANDGRGPEIEELAWETEHFPDEVRTMDWNALRDLVARGVEVESHTLSHPHLPRLSDAELDRELRESKEQLEDELRKPCRFLAYPYGAQDARVRGAARRAGYVAAFGLPGKLYPLDRYALPRVGLYRRDTAVTTALKTSTLGRRLSYVR